MQSLSIIIPVFNEEKTLLSILKKLEILKSKCKLEIIIVNDGSKDNSKEIIESNKNLYSNAIHLMYNSGKGKAVIEGIKNCTHDYILIQDADEEYDPNDYVKFLECSEKFEADLVIGSRFIYDRYTRSHNFLNKIGNSLITLLFNLIYNTTFTDIYCCYIFFKKKLIQPEQLQSKGFEQHAEILSKIVKKGNKFFEVPVNYNGRTIIEGKKIRYYHIFSIIYQMIKNRFI